MNLTQHIKFVFTLVFRALTIVAAVATAVSYEWQLMAIALLTFFLTFLPSIYQRSYKITLPNEYEILVLFFLFGTLYLGEIHAFYELYWWWDILLHTLSGALMFIFAMSLLLIMDREHRIIFKSPFFVVLFGVSFALAMGSLWELFEWFMDSSFGTNMLKVGLGEGMQSGLEDTLTDLLNNTQGALIAGFLGYFELKYHWKEKVFEHIFNRSHPGSQEFGFQKKEK